MNKLFILFILSFLFKQIFLSNPCDEIEVKPYESNEIFIERGKQKCVFFSFDNPSKSGNIILKLTKSNSYTSMIYIYDNIDDIVYNDELEVLENSIIEYHIGEEFFKEKKIEGLNKQKYYFVIFENDFYFKDELIIYNDKFDNTNYYELNKIDKNQNKEFNFKYEYTNDNPIIMHFKITSNDIKYLNYQLSNINKNIKSSFFIYENNLDGKEINKPESVNDYIKLKSNIDYYIKIITNGEINIILEFLDTKVMKITPDDIFQKDIITTNEYYFYIEKELTFENDEYFNEFTLKLDSINLDYMPFEVQTNICNKNTEDDLIKCIDGVSSIPKTIIKRDIDIPYIYHIYYSFNGLDYLVIKIINKNTLEKKQRLIIEASGGNDLIDRMHDKVFTDNKGYLYPVYLNVSIEYINDELNKNKSRIMFIYTNTTSAIKVFYSDDTFKNENLNIKKEEYFTIENSVYGFDFNTKDVKKLFGNRKYFTIMIYCPWESSPISFQITFINDNIHNFNYLIDKRRPIKKPIKISFNSSDDKYYFIGQYNENSNNILFNEVVYGKIKAKYKFFNGNEKISRIIFNETALGYDFTKWTPIYNRIDIIEITCLSPALLYMHFIENNAIKINDIIFEKGSQNYLFLNNTNTYNLLLSNDLKEGKNINIEVLIVSERENQSLGININNDSFILNSTEKNSLLRYNTEDKNLNKFEIKGMGKPTTFRIKIGADIDNNDKKIIAFYKEYKKTEEKNNNISQKININIINNNNKNAKLCYSMNFVGKNYLYSPKDENCFELNKNEKTTLTMYNPWDKYLINYNRLYNYSDPYYIMIYVEDSSLIDKLEFNSKEEFLNFNSKYNENELIRINKQEKNIIKSSKKDNHTILIQFSPINNKNNKNSKKDIEDKFIIKTKLDEIIKEGKIYNKNNRTFVAFADPLIESLLEFNISNEYEIKYNFISNNNNFNEEKINNNYSLEYYNDKSSYIQFKPLIKGKDIDYSLYLSLDTKIDLVSISSLKKLKNDGKKLYIITKKLNSNNDYINIELNSDISKKIKDNNCLLNILAEENEIYHISMSYDVLEKEKGKGKSGSSSGIVFLWILIIIIIGVGAYFGYYYYIKKKNRKDDELLDKINDVNLSMEDQAGRGENTEEGVV